MKTFKLIRTIDVTGVSGTGPVCEGVVFSNGVVVITWLGRLTSTTVHESIENVIKIHGHDGKTEVVWE